mgnify:CR=1 FL=1
MKVIIKHLLIRFAILAVPLFSLFLLYYFLYDPHTLCVGDYHRHTGGPFGYVLLAGAIVVFWGIALIAEIILRLVKKDRTSSLINLFLLIFVVLFLLFLL